MSIPNGHKAGCKCFPCRIHALTQERDELRLTVGRQAKIIANHQHASTKSESFALPAIILSVICGAMCGGVVAKHPAVPVAPWWLIVAGIILFVVVAAVAVLTMGAMSSSAASLDPPTSGEEEAL